MSTGKDKKGERTDDHAVAWPPPATRLRGDSQKDLFSLLGDVGDVRPSPNFVERTLAYVAEREIRESRTAGAGIWKWGGLAAAASILAVCGYFFSGDKDRPSEAGREKPPTQLESVAMVSAPNDDQLTAFEIDGLEEINEAWFGG